MSKNILELNETSFDSIKNENISVVDFWAPWCMPCLIQSPILENASKNPENDKAKFYKVNVDDNREISYKFNISSIPTLIVFKNGKEVKRLNGLQTEENIIESIKDLN